MMPEMRVLHAVHGFAPEFRGGVEMYVEALAAAQRARGDDAFVLSGSDNGRLPARLSEEDVSGVPVFRLEGLAPHTERLRDRPDGEALIRKPVRELLAVLDPATFKQIHRSTIVNMKAVAALTKDDSGRGTIRLKNRPETLPVSLSFMPLFRNM